MSYQQGIHQFVPGYVVKSDFLPTRVSEGTNSQTNELVHIPFIIAQKLLRRKEKRQSFYAKACRIQSQQVCFLQDL